MTFSATDPSCLSSVGPATIYGGDKVKFPSRQDQLSGGVVWLQLSTWFIESSSIQPLIQLHSRATLPTNAGWPAHQAHARPRQ